MSRTLVDIPPDICGAFIVQVLGYFAISIVGSEHSDDMIRVIVESDAVPENCEDKLCTLEEIVTVGEDRVTKTLRFVVEGEG